MIGPGLRSFGTNAIFCLSFLLEGMGIGCLSHLSYPQSRHLSPCITGCATTLCLGSGCGAGGDFTSMDRQTSTSRGHRPCLYLPPPSPYLCERAQIHGQKGGGDSTPIPPPNTTKIFWIFQKPLKLCRPLHHSGHFLLSCLPRF